MWNSSEKSPEHLNQILKKIYKGVLKCTFMSNVAAPTLSIRTCTDRLINYLYKTDNTHTKIINEKKEKKCLLHQEL